jgi:hypothetical protein
MRWGLESVPGLIYGDGERMAERSSAIERGDGRA